MSLLNKICSLPGSDYLDCLFIRLMRDYSTLYAFADPVVREEDAQQIVIVIIG